MLLSFFCSTQLTPVISCNSQDNAHLKSYNPTFTHEEIISFCLNSKVFGGEEGYERAEVEWAQSEVGEGVEETWERSVSSFKAVGGSTNVNLGLQWNVAGRFVSTLGDHCESDDSVSAQSVPAFFHALHQLHQGLPTASFLSDSDVSRLVPWEKLTCSDSLQITPSFDVTYSLAEIELALRFRDHQPVVSCRANFHHDSADIMKGHVRQHDPVDRPMAVTSHWEIPIW